MQPISYNRYFSPGVDAFTAGRDCPLPYPVVQGHQVHGRQVAVVTRQDTTREELDGIDALVTNVPGVAIGVRTADCVPVLLYEPEARVVAAVHSGWRGTVQNICAAAIDVMQRQFGARPERMQAVIGPSICRESFQVGPEVVEAFAEAGFPMDDILTDEGPKTDQPMRGGLHIDLWQANRWLLMQACLPPQQIHVAGLCTYLRHELFYSARYEGNKHDCRNINWVRLNNSAAL